MDTEPQKILKICNPAPFIELLESKGSKLSGIFAPQVNNYLQVIEKVSNSSTVIGDSYPGWGSQIGQSEMYDGCLGQLQRGEADLIASGIDYPLDIVNVSQGFIMLDEKISFLGVFRRPAVVKSADFSRSLNAFHWSIYLLIAAYLVMFALVFKVRMQAMRSAIKSRMSAEKQSKVERKVNRIKSLSLVGVIRCFIRSISVEPNTTSFSILVFSISIFSFFIFSHFNSLLNTDRVVTEKARIFKSYNEIMQAEIRPVFFQGTSYFRDLKFAKKGSEGNTFWNWAVETFQEKNLLTPFTLDYLGFYVAEELKGKILIFAGEIIAKSLKSTICDLLDRSTPKLEFLLNRFVDGFDIDDQLLEDLQIYIRTDESAVSMIKSIVIGKGLLESKEHFRIAKLFFLRSFEHGHIQANIQFFETTKLITALPGAEYLLGQPVATKSEVKYRCKEYNVPVPKIPKIDHLTFFNFKISFFACVLLSVCSVALLLLEFILYKMIIDSRKHPNEERRMRRCRVNYFAFESTYYERRNFMLRKY